MIVRKAYRGELVLQDVQTIDGERLSRAHVIVASPPCAAFSAARSDRNRPRPADLELVLQTLRVIREADPLYWAIENVRGAMGWFEPMLGKPTFKNDPWFLWGHLPQFLLPRQDLRLKTKFRSAWLRARVPQDLARPLAKAIFEELQEGVG